MVFLLAAATAVAQEQRELGKDVADSAGDIAEFIIENVGRRTAGRAEILLNLSSYSFEGRRSSFGELLSAEVRTELIDTAPASIAVLASEFEGLLQRNSPGFTLPAADFVVAGQIIRMDRVLKVNTSIIDPRRGIIFASHQDELELNSAIISMLGSGELGQTADLYEPDSMDNPNVIEAGAQIDDHTLAPAGDEDWFVFAAERQRVVSFGTRGGVDTVVTVYAADDRYSPIAQNDDFREGENARASIVTEPGRRYLFKVSGYDDAAVGPYTVYAEAEEIDDPLELNNSMESATEFPVGRGAGRNDDWATDRESWGGANGGSPGGADGGADGGVRGGADGGARPGVVDTQFYPQGDVDWYRFSVPAGRSPQVTIETYSDIDPMLRLYSAEGMEIASDDDGGSDYNARISQQLRGGATYYLEVSEIDDAVGRYRLEISGF